MRWPRFPSGWGPFSFHPDNYELTRFVLLRWLGFVYLVAFYAAAWQLVPLVGSDGLTPATLFLQQVREALGSSWSGFWELPMFFWLDCSDTSLRVLPWLGVFLSCALLAGYTNALVLGLLWFLYLSIVHVGQDWYGYGWEIQLLETGFLSIFLCPLLDLRPFPRRPPPLPIILLFRWLIVRIMLGSGLIKWRGDSCWHDFTALYYFFETQPIPNPLSRTFHFLPHPLLQLGTLLTFVVELGAPWLAFGPRWSRYVAGTLIVSFQGILILCGNLSFFNWLTILPALACFDDRVWRRILPGQLLRLADDARGRSRSSQVMTGIAWLLAGLVGLLSIQPVMNLFSSNQRMNTSFDPFHLVNTYGAFGTVGRTRDVIIFEGTQGDSSAPESEWKPYTFRALPGDPAQAPMQIAPYQPHLDWQLWFAAMATPEQYPWTLNLVWKLLHNDPVTLSLLGGNPFPARPPRYIRAVHYVYHFAEPGNAQHVYWTRERVDLWLPPLSINDFTKRGSRMRTGYSLLGNF